MKKDPSLQALDDKAFYDSANGSMQDFKQSLKNRGEASYTDFMVADFFNKKRRRKFKAAQYLSEIEDVFSKDFKLNYNVHPVQKSMIAIMAASHVIVPNIKSGKYVEFEALISEASTAKSNSLLVHTIEATLLLLFSKKQDAKTLKVVSDIIWDNKGKWQEKFFGGSSVAHRDKGVLEFIKVINAVKK